MLFADGITRSVISARVGNACGSGKVELDPPRTNESGGLTIESARGLVDVVNYNEIDIPENTNVSVARIDGGQLAIVNFNRKCAVQIPGLGSVYFLTELPNNPDGVEIELGAWIDIPSNVHAWPPSVKAPEQVLCRSKEDPKHYKLYKYRREIEGTDWEDTGLLFGGTFTAESWERFHRTMASFQLLDAVPVEESR